MCVLFVTGREGEGDEIYARANVAEWRRVSAENDVKVPFPFLAFPSFTVEPR